MADHDLGYIRTADIVTDALPYPGTPELQAALENVYQGKILAEAIDAGEREPVKK